MNTPNKPSKFKTKNRVEINDESRGTYNSNSQIKFKTSILKSRLCDYGDAHVLLSGAITVFGAAYDAARAGDRNNKQAIFKNCAPSADFITEINNTKVDNVKDLLLFVVDKSMYDLIEFRDNYSKTSRSFAKMSQIMIWQILNNLNLNQNSYIILIMNVLYMQKKNCVMKILK